MKLSIIVPVYNEEATLAEIVRRIQATRFDKEIIIIDDGSRDGTGEILKKLEADAPGNVRVLRHAANRGKGAAIITGLQAASGELTVIQDADLEYDPGDYERLVEPFANASVQVVYGSRILARNDRSSFLFYWGGRFLSLVTNLIYGSRITDEATGYKIFRTALLRDLRLVSTGFEFCPEVTAKILRRKIPIHEVPISYKPRSWEEGKKIHWTDGLRAVWVLLRFRFKRF
jgi:glycosyltransferase involved in cell wall biosynthesis